MKKDYFYFLLAMLFLAGLGLGVGSCKDDDDDDNNNANNEQPADGVNPLDNDEADAAWRWLCQLTDVQTLSTDWASKTYEPSVGQQSEQNQNTRIVVVNDLNEAKMLFANLADVTTDKLAQTYTAKQDGVGTLTWTPSAAGAENLAEVEVDTKLIPHLQRIVYCTEEQRGNNGLFSENVDGIAYYRFGDVIREEATGDYWVCARPSFWQNDKGESHWICIANSNISQSLPTGNIYDKYNNNRKYEFRTIMLPTALKYSREHMNNLSNFLWALLDRDAYANHFNYTGTKNALGGFSYEFHGVRFLKNVAEFWSANNPSGRTIWQLLFNRSREEMMKMKEMTFIYKGYQWRVGQTGYVWEFTTKKSDGFQTIPQGSESGDKKLYNFGGQGYDIRRYTSLANADQEADGPQQFADGHYYWVVRYRKGSEMMVRGKYSPYEPINGYTDIYRYNAKTGDKLHEDVVSDDDVKVLNPVTNNKEYYTTTDFRLRSHYNFGDVYRDENGHRWIVVYPSGRDDMNKTHDIFSYKETTPYSELISFEGLETSANKSCVTNLPTRDQAIRGNQWLYILFTNSVYIRNLDNSGAFVPQLAKQIISNANVDVRCLFQMVASLSGNPRNHTQQGAFAYRIPGVTDRQPLMRFILPIDISNEDVPYFYREHYVANPDKTAIQYQPNQFSQELIYLQDMADKTKVDKYAADFYACQPIIDITGGDGVSKREGRTQADPRANDVTNYFYNKDVWDRFEYPTDMWCEPINFFRMDRIYDRGETEYATITAGGHTLTLVARYKEYIYDEEFPEGVDNAANTAYSTIETVLSVFGKPTNRWDGKAMTFPTWKQAWLEE